MKTLARTLGTVAVVMLASVRPSSAISSGQPVVVPTDAASSRVLIAFVSAREGNNEIYVMDVDGSSVRNLTNNRAWDTHPAWSPDGRKIAFWSSRDRREGEIYLMDADGSNVKRLTTNGADIDKFPAWSPDGKRIAFLSAENGQRHVFTIDVDGSNRRRLTPHDQDEKINYRLFYGSLAWSPDGRKIAFASARGDGRHWAQDETIHIMDADGSNHKRLAKGTYVIWSPDGKRMTFTSGAGIFLMNPDGSRQKRLAKGAYPAWSPDGARIALLSPRNGTMDIINQDGSDRKTLTQLEAWDGSPLSWLPDGKGIVFTCKYEICRTDINTSLLKTLTGNLGGRAPAVSPPLVIPAK